MKNLAPTRLALPALSIGALIGVIVGAIICYVAGCAPARTEVKRARVVTVRLHCLREMKRPIKHRAPARFHVGTSEIMGTVSLLDCDTIDPGGWGLAQLFLEEPATTTWGVLIREWTQA